MHNDECFFIQKRTIMDSKMPQQYLVLKAMYIPKNQISFVLSLLPLITQHFGQPILSLESPLTTQNTILVFGHCIVLPTMFLENFWMMFLSVFV